MYYRIMSMLLSVSLLTGGIPATTYESGLTNAVEYEYVTEDAAVEAEPEEIIVENTVSGNEAEGAISENTVSRNETEDAITGDSVSATESEETTTEEIVSETVTEETVVEDMVSEVESEETSAEDGLSDNGAEEFTNEETASEETTADETVVKDTVIEAVTSHVVAQESAENSKGQSLTIDKTEVSAYTIGFYYTLINTDVSLENETFLIKMYYRKTGTNDEWNSESAWSYQSSIYLYDLEPETSYDYVIGIASSSLIPMDSLGCKIEGTVQTVADDRRIYVKVIPGQLSVAFEVALTGEVAENFGNYIYYEYREKGTDSQGAVFSGYDYLHHQGNIRIEKNVKYSTLKTDTEYEYWIGLATDFESNQYVDLKTGTFRTQKDSRKIVNAQVHPGYNQAQLKYVATTSYYERESTIHVCYKESGADAWNSHYDGFSASWNHYSKNDTITGLEPGKTYDYAIIWTDNYDENNPDNYEEGDRKVSGTFTTKTFNYSLDIKQDMEKQDINSAVLNVMATGGNKDATLLVSLDVYEQDEQVKTVEFVLPETAKYKSNVMISGLSAGKEYTVKKATVSVVNGTSKQKIGELLLDNICFKTAEAINPTQITASKNEVCLNIANPENGYAKEEITLSFAPQNASIPYSVKEFDETIIQVEENDSDKFTISGIKSGETELFIQSDYAPDVNEKIHVNVKNYVVAKKGAATEMEGTSTEIISGALEVRKDSALNEIGYYEVKEDGSLVLLEDIIIKNSNPSVAEVTQKDNVVSIIPKTVGTTYVDFEKDGFKNRIQIKVSHAKYYASVTGFEGKSSYYNHPAIKVDENTFILSKYVNYQFVGKVSPEMPFDMTKYTVQIDGSSVDYDETTQILETDWAGKSTVRLYPTDEAVAEGYVNSIYLTIVVKDTPSQPDYEINVITNGRKNIRLKDVELPEELKDSWEWKYPDMPVYVIPRDEGTKEYTLHYTKDDKYPEDEEVEVNVIKYNELIVTEQGEEHRGAILVHNDGTTQPDTIQLSLQATANIDKEGLLEYELLSKKKGLTIEKAEDGTYKVTAQKAGTYTLTANAYVREYNENNEPVKGRKILTTTYKINAVKEAQARDIQLTTDSEEFIVNEDGTIHYVSSSGIEGKTFTLNAKVLGADKSLLNTTLEWSITNKNIATVSYDKKNSHKAVVTLKDYGKAAIRIRAKDKAGVNKEIPIQIVNGAPHLLTSKVTVNLAYDYDTWQGENLAEANNGLIKVAKGQDGEIDELCLWNSEGEVDSRFGFIAEESDYIVRPKYYDIPTGKYKCTLGVRAETYGEWYKYPIEITVINKQPKVTIKTTQKPNLFYRYQMGRIDFSANGLCYIGQIDWISNSKSGNGFHIIPRDTLSDIPYLEIEHKNVKTKGNKLADTGCAKGTLVIEMEGCREPLIVKNYKIEYTYKKPTIQLDGGKAKSKYVIPDMDGGMFNIKLYDSLTKQYLQKVDSLSYTNTNYYHSIESNSKNVTTSCVGENLTVEYLGKKNKEAVTYTLNSLAWREPLKVKYNIQVQKPTMSLTTNSIVCNKDIESSIRTTIVNGKKQPMDKVAGVKYSGEDAKAEELIQSGILEIVSNAADLDIKYHCAKQLQTDMNLKAGTYTIQLTPYYMHEKTGEIQDLNTLTLKIKITDKPVSATVTVKGTCDLVARSKPTAYFQAKFSNMDQSYQVKDAKLVGEASELFKISKDTSKGNSVTNSYYIFAEQVSGYKYLLKAGVTYSFAVEYTIQATNRADGSEGETFVVRSNTVKVKTKQSVPQIKLSRNNVIAYVTGKEVDLKCKVIVPKGFYLSKVNGEVDIDKDGVPDMYVSISPHYKGYENIWLRIYDENQLVATKKGKTYTIPLKITLTGSDGVSKEPVVNLKVTLKQ